MIESSPHSERRPVDPIKVAVCEAMIALNGDDPIIPPTAIDWIGNAITSAVKASGHYERIAAVVRAADNGDGDMAVYLDALTADDIEAVSDVHHATGR